MRSIQETVFETEERIHTTTGVTDEVNNSL